ncbi:hypothetical protein BDP27DRAFT_1364834 [Rhodocollybia butyracea]|uniref:Uncharacterized protein n=1 Tax=Rhodocollybia butyracea TaxID=206335 RepID=A0A9P5PP97_9AGAR|nr:hypothetical protein BDP27DRAFT_1364834 [Rhodocollybia butyracea]
MHFKLSFVATLVTLAVAIPVPHIRPPPAPAPPSLPLPGPTPAPVSLSLPDLFIRGHCDLSGIANPALVGAGRGVAGIIRPTALLDTLSSMLFSLVGHLATHVAQGGGVAIADLAPVHAIDALVQNLDDVAADTEQGTGVAAANAALAMVDTLHASIPRQVAPTVYYTCFLSLEKPDPVARSCASGWRSPDILCSGIINSLDVILGPTYRLAVATIQWDTYILFDVLLDHKHYACWSMYTAILEIRPSASALSYQLGLSTIFNKVLYSLELAISISRWEMEKAEKSRTRRKPKKPREANVKPLYHTPLGYTVLKQKKNSKEKYHTATILVPLALCGSLPIVNRRIQPSPSNPDGAKMAHHCTGKTVARPGTMRHSTIMVFLLF